MKKEKRTVDRKFKKDRFRIFRKEKSYAQLYFRTGRDLQYWKSSSPQFATYTCIREKTKTDSAFIHCKKENEGFRTSSKVQYVAKLETLLMVEQNIRSALQILKVIFKL